MYRLYHSLPLLRSILILSSHRHRCVRKMRPFLMFLMQLNTPCELILNYVTSVNEYTLAWEEDPRKLRSRKQLVVLTHIFTCCWHFCYIQLTVNKIAPEVRHPCNDLFTAWSAVSFSHPIFREVGSCVARLLLQVQWSITLHSTHKVHLGVSYDAQNKQTLFIYTTLTSIDVCNGDPMFYLQ